MAWRWCKDERESAEAHRAKIALDWGKTLVEKFIEEYIRKIALEPSAVRVESELVEAELVQIIVYASNQDTGRLIGKDGKMIGAIKTLVSACKAKDGRSYKITIKAAD